MTEMTPEQRAAAVAGGDWLRHFKAYDRLRALIAEAVEAAVAEEREACAKVADDTNQWIGAAIRERGTT